jgi:4-aminobutyrate aminotransferase-like enzyme
MTVLGAFNPEIQKETDRLLKLILKEQEKITAIRPPLENKKNTLSTSLKEFETLRGRNFFFSYMSSGRGNGPFTELLDGSVKYDLINSIGFNLLGHAHPLYIQAHLENASCDSVMGGNLLTYQEPYILCKTMLEAVKKTRLRHMWFSCSGSMANDTALKIIWQKCAPRYKLIAFENAFAGRSIATQDITHYSGYREGMPRSIDVVHVPHYDYKNPAQAISKTLAHLDKVWNDAPDQFCALMLELVQGEAGFIYGTKEYYQQVLRWAKDKNLIIWVDEIQTFARTRELFAFQMFGLDELVDVVTIAKVLQCGATFYTDELNPKPGLIAGTFNGSLAAINAGNKIILHLLGNGYYGENGKNYHLEKTFIGRLQALSQGSCRGRLGYAGGVGTMISFEVGDASKEITDKFLKNLFTNGIIAFSAGRNPTRVRFLLPVCLNTQHIDEIFTVLEKTILDTIPAKV